MDNLTVGKNPDSSILAGCEGDGRTGTGENNCSHGVPPSSDESMDPDDWDWQPFEGRKPLFFSPIDEPLDGIEWFDHEIPD